MMVQLGYAQEQESWLLTNRFFPSKIGKKPSWLELTNIPKAEDLLCDFCQEPCIFLCQIYAGSAHVSHAFHRSIFVFICRNGKCCQENLSGNIKVLRSQLGLKNPFYPDKPAIESEDSEEIEVEVKLCKLCGCRGPLTCSKCKESNYCSKLHQKLDWGTHKLRCGISEETVDISNKTLFPEFEIVIEQENSDHVSKKESEKDAEKRRLKEYEDMVKCVEAGEMSNVYDADLNELPETKEDKKFGKFKKTIEGYEEQVLRYNRHGSPLWISDYGILDPSKVPKCSNCNGKRTFEFQIMPQMLNELENYELDWGIIAVYTCEKDCDIIGKYAPEYCYKQDLTKDDEQQSQIDMENMKASINELQQTRDDKQKVNNLNSTSKEMKESKSKIKSKQKNTKKETFEESDIWE
ncbi:CLUMA_CG020372, isoform A [Clunio marinus]|uniref:CLUMA_CG020372, isoform A n=1 Tax=Clunio marinus TaxID=568069 RepID=A0A1J1J4T3_9DIPT|nr:CLUMA_CG020372, isoform A [Clunio marinus]